MPVTSWPASAALAAATAESTPPDMAASTRSLFIRYEGIRRSDPRPPRCSRVVGRAAGAGGPAGAPHDLTEDGGDAIDIGLRRGVPEREPQRAAGPGVVRAHRQ